ncbi:MAG: hypothetical protein JSS66_06295 [Armatimonadetes bacterium]|nr:hypothetical protein [Armatimonadota bacterium]
MGAQPKVLDKIAKELGLEPGKYTHAELADKVKDCVTLVKRAYPEDHPSFCSRHQQKTADCTICYPDVWGLIGEHVKVGDQIAKERDEALRALKKFQTAERRRGWWGRLFGREG